jgi:hypothetical protein
MTELTRRSLLTGTVATAATAAVPLATSSLAHAAAPPAGTQAPGWYRYKVGSFEITVVTDGVNRFKFPDNIVANAKREDVNSALAAAHLPSDIFVTPYNPIVVNTGRKLVVIDTGLGEAGFNASKGANGQFLTNLAAAGIDAKAIDAHWTCTEGHITWHQGLDIPPRNAKTQDHFRSLSSVVACICSCSGH